MVDKSILNSLERKQQYRYPFFLLGCYLTCLLTTVCLANRLIVIGDDWILPGGIFAFPFTFCICDIVGEVYGYAYPRLFIWIGIGAELLFACIVTGVSHLKSPSYFHYGSSYIIVFDPTFRYVMSGLAGLLVGEFFNIYLLAKCKIILRGQFYIFRSILSTTLGQALLTVIVDILNYAEKMPISQLFHMMLYGFIWKIGFAMLFAFPSWMLVHYLKKKENIDYYDVNTNFNPFLLRLDGNLEESVSKSAASLQPTSQ